MRRIILPLRLFHVSSLYYVVREKFVTQTCNKIDLILFSHRVALALDNVFLWGDIAFTFVTFHKVENWFQCVSIKTIQNESLSIDTGSRQALHSLCFLTLIGFTLQTRLELKHSEWRACLDTLV